MKNEMTWENYGDVNPIEHGGKWIHKEGETTFRIIRLEFDDHQQKNLLHDLHVDISDSWIDRDDIISYADLSEDTDYFAEDFAIACITYYSVENFGCHENIYLTLEESAEYLKTNYGIITE